MPTDLPDMVALKRHRRRRLRHAATPVLLTIIYLLLVAWNVATFDTSFMLPAFESGRHIGAYNPMEPSNRPAGDPIRLGLFAQR
jgi:hypothetical protein